MLREGFLFYFLHLQAHGHEGFERNDSPLNPWTE